VSLRQNRGDLADLDTLAHPARRILRQYKHRGAPVVLQTPPWTRARTDAAMDRGSHSSAQDHIDFLRAEFTDMVHQAQWVVLPYRDVRHLPGLRISPMGVVPQHERRPRTIVDYSFSDLNQETVRIAPLDAMQFGHTLPRLLRHIVLANPAQGPVHLIKVDIADGFYRIGLRPLDVPKLGVALPVGASEPQLVAFPITLPMGWTNSPPIFCAATETIADLANMALWRGGDPGPHRLEALAATPAPPPPSLVHQHCSGRSRGSVGASPNSFCAGLPPPSHTRTASQGRPCAARDVSTLPPPLSTPLSRDPHLAAFSRRPLATVDVFVDDFIAAAQGNAARLSRVRRILLTAIDQVFRPLDAADSPHRREPASVKKLLQGDASWDTCKTILGWILDTEQMTLSLPPRRLTRLAALLVSIPPTQKRTTMKRWQQMLGELRSMALAIPGSRGLFSQMQEALRSRDTKNRITLRRGVHDAIRDFQHLYNDLARRPTRLFELVPLAPTVIGTHDASGQGMGGALLPTPTAITRAWELAPTKPRETAHPVVWRAKFPTDISEDLVSWAHPHGAITNSDLELAGSLIHHEAAVQCFDLRERTILSKTDNTPTLFWQRKGSTTTTGPPAYLLRAQALHQRHHRYVPRHDFLPGVDNLMSDDASRLHHLSDNAFLTHFNCRYPQHVSWQLWTPSPEILSAVTMSLRRQPCEPALLLHEPRPATPTGNGGSRTAMPWPSAPLSRPSLTRSVSFRSGQSVTDKASSPVNVTLSGLEPWKMPYAALHRRSRVWANPTHAAPRKVRSTSGCNV
jgi:hypothetical protein